MPASSLGDRLGARLRVRREAIGWSQAQLAEAVGVTPQSAEKTPEDAGTADPAGAGSAVAATGISGRRGAGGAASGAEGAVAASVGACARAEPAVRDRHRAAQPRRTLRALMVRSATIGCAPRGPVAVDRVTPSKKSEDPPPPWGGRGVTGAAGSSPLTWTRHGGKGQCLWPWPGGSSRPMGAHHVAGAAPMATLVGAMARAHLIAFVFASVRPSRPWSRRSGPAIRAPSSRRTTFRCSDGGSRYVEAFVKYGSSASSSVVVPFSTRCPGSMPSRNTRRGRPRCTTAGPRGGRRSR
jgi:hypothetical protein